MNKKNLAIELSKLKHLTKFDVKLEQYETESEFASHLLWLAYNKGDINGKFVSDLGSGNGVLGIGALLLGAKFVYFLDSDQNAVEVCKDNLNGFYFKDNYELICDDVYSFNKKVDTVIMNPPFGVQNRKADKKFLETAMKYSNVIYSVHKIESENFINELCKDNGFSVINIVKKYFIIRKTYKFHSKNRYDVNVGIWVMKRNI